MALRLCDYRVPERGVASGVSADAPKVALREAVVWIGANRPAVLLLTKHDGRLSRQEFRNPNSK